MEWNGVSCAVPGGFAVLGGFAGVLRGGVVRYKILKTNRKVEE